MYHRKKAAETTFVRNIRTLNVDEIDTRFHFHQYLFKAFAYESILCSFYVLTIWFCNVLVQRNLAPKLLAFFIQNFGAKNALLYKKRARKMLMKLTGGINFTNI